MPLFFAASPSPYPSDITVTQSTGGSPGFLGFVFTFLLALAAVFLFLSLTRQLRRVDRRAKQQEEQAQEEQAQEEQEEQAQELDGKVPSARPAPDDEDRTDS